MEFDCNNDVVGYSADIEEIIIPGCATAGCHPKGSTNGDCDLSSYDLIRSYIEQNETPFINSIQHIGPKPMPLNGEKLPSDIIDKILCWIGSDFPE